MSEYFRKPIVKTLMLKGQEGQSIKGITKTNTSGLVDTYTITLTDGTTSTFTVTNGEKGDAGSILNLKIGGVNLLSGTKYLKKQSGFFSHYDILENDSYMGFSIRGGIVPETSNPVLIQYDLIKKLNFGDTLTLSFYAKGNAKIRAFFFGGSGYVKSKPISSNGKILSDSFGDGQTIFELSSTWKKYYVTWKQDDKGDTTVNKTILIRTNSTEEKGKELYACGIKFEREETPTDWTPSLEDVESDIASAKDILNKTYPIGSIYISVNSTSPAKLFGGTWEQIKDRFLLGASETYSSGSTGGEATHTLTVDEMPRHTHDIRTNSNDGNVEWTVQDHQSNAKMESLEWHWGGSSISYAGGSQPHNNMPPYLAVYMWKRIS